MHAEGEYDDIDVIMYLEKMIGYAKRFRDEGPVACWKWEELKDDILKATQVLNDLVQRNNLKGVR